MCLFLFYFLTIRFCHVIQKLWVIKKTDFQINCSKIKHFDCINFKFVLFFVGGKIENRERRHEFHISNPKKIQILCKLGKTLKYEIWYSRKVDTLRLISCPQTEGGNRGIWRKPPKQSKNMQIQCMHCGGNQDPDAEDGRHLCKPLNYHTIYSSYATEITITLFKLVEYI